MDLLTVWAYGFLWLAHWEPWGGWDGLSTCLGGPFLRSDLLSHQSQPIVSVVCFTMGGSIYSLVGDETT